MAVRQGNRSVWPWFALRGVAALLFGLGCILFLLWPVYSLVWLFAVYALADGVIALAAGLRVETRASFWLLMAEGAAGVAAALLAALLAPLWSMLLPLLVGGWAVSTGVLKAAQVIHLREGPRRVWALGVAAFGSVLMGLAMALATFLIPQQWPTGWNLLWLIAAYALGLGIVLLGSCRYYLRFECD